MNDLITFLNARLDEDKRYLNSNARHLWTQRPLREVAAKRALIEIAWQHAATIDGEWGCAHTVDEIKAGECSGSSPDESEICRVLAAVYNDHPDYQAAWKP